MAQEILTAEEFAHRLKIGRSTLFEWLRNGVLETGVHYVKIGRILRFNWNEDVFSTLKTPQIQQTVSKKVSKKKLSQQSKIDWEY
ncbi:MAG: helix-turn-helix domain-containing protein [Pelobacteraceae bacterium]